MCGVKLDTYGVDDKGTDFIVLSSYSPSDTLVTRRITVASFPVRAILGKVTAQITAYDAVTSTLGVGDVQFLYRDPTNDVLTPIGPTGSYAYNNSRRTYAADTQVLLVPVQGVGMMVIPTPSNKLAVLTSVLNQGSSSPATQIYLAADGVQTYGDGLTVRDFFLNVGESVPSGTKIKVENIDGVDVAVEIYCTPSNTLPA